MFKYMCGRSNWNRNIKCTLFPPPSLSLSRSLSLSLVRFIIKIKRVPYKIYITFIYACDCSAQDDSTSSSSKNSNNNSNNKTTKLCYSLALVYGMFLGYVSIFCHTHAFSKTVCQFRIDSSSSAVCVCVPLVVFLPIHFLFYVNFKLKHVY